MGDITVTKIDKKSAIEAYHLVGEIENKQRNP